MFVRIFITFGVIFSVFLWHTSNATDYVTNYTFTAVWHGAAIGNQSDEVAQSICNKVKSGSRGSIESVSIQFVTNIGGDGGSTSFKIVVCKNNKGVILRCVCNTNRDGIYAVFNYSTSNNRCTTYDTKSISL